MINMKASRFRLLFRRQEFLLMITIMLLIIVTSVINPLFLQVGNVKNILLQVSIMGIVTMGMTVVMVSGGIDLSVGNQINFAGGVMAVLIVNDCNIFLAIIISILCGVATSFINGIIISRTNAPPFIITLGTSSLFYGIALYVTNAANYPIGSSLDFIGEENMLGIPVPIIAFILISILSYILLKKTRYGRRIFAMGSNEEAAFLCGLDTKNYKLSAYCLNGLIIGLAAVVLTARLGTATPAMGDGYDLKPIAACAIGGVSLAGGSGSILGSFLGILLLGIVQNALNILGVSTFSQYVVLGAIIVLSVIISRRRDN